MCTLIIFQALIQSETIIILLSESELYFPPCEFVSYLLKKEITFPQSVLVTHWFIPGIQNKCFPHHNGLFLSVFHRIVVVSYVTLERYVCFSFNTLSVSLTHRAW